VTKNKVILKIDFLKKHVFLLNMLKTRVGMYMCQMFLLRVSLEQGATTMSQLFF